MIPPPFPVVITGDAASAVDVAIVGAGAAGLATAIALRRANAAVSTILFDGARRPGAKILVSGGTRCNVTNRDVTERDFWGGRTAIIRRILRAFTADAAVRWFRGIGVTLHEESDGKLFPDSGRARDVLNALLREAESAGAVLCADHRVLDIHHSNESFIVITTRGAFTAHRVVLATGGQSLPKTGSDGAGYDFARKLGHSIVPTTPALVPLVLDGAAEGAIHHRISGVAHDGELAVWVGGRVATRLSGSLLWTHFGLSGPVALNASRHWLRAQLEGRPVRLTANFCHGATFDSEEARWIRLCSARPKVSVSTALSDRVPASVAAAMLESLEIDAATPLAQLSRDDRRSLVRALVEWPLRVTGSRGYNFAEATAGGVPLEEIDPSTMESRKCRGLYLVGEMLDADGRIGGFNFQWAWSTGFVAGRALATSGRSRAGLKTRLYRHDVSVDEF